jgi:small subunit ribosomal protein S1
MSERRAVREWRATQKKELLDDLHEGDVRKGRVSSVADFGVFVDLGGADGLVHVSELTFERGKHPRDVVKVGDEVEVLVLSLDRDRKRIGLSMKRLQRDPWTAAEEDHYVGQILDAEISNLTKFGAFARLPSGLEGLVHVSEISDEHVEHPREAVRPGQKVVVEILSIDPDRQRIGLSMRRVPEHLRLPEEPESASAAEEPPPRDSGAAAGEGEAAGSADAGATDAEETARTTPLPEAIEAADSALDSAADTPPAPESEDGGAGDDAGGADDENESDDEGESDADDDDDEDESDDDDDESDDDDDDESDDDEDDDESDDDDDDDDEDESDDDE